MYRGRTFLLFVLNCLAHFTAPSLSPISPLALQQAWLSALTPLCAKSAAHAAVWQPDNSSPNVRLAGRFVYSPSDPCDSSRPHISSLSYNTPSAPFVVPNSQCWCAGIIAASVVVLCALLVAPRFAHSHVYFQGIPF